jgi:hypothetical protein
MGSHALGLLASKAPQRRPTLHSLAAAMPGPTAFLWRKRREGSSKIAIVHQIFDCRLPTNA